MPGEGRRGRRDNGLDAVAFVPLLDVDPRVGEHLLDVLGSAGVPAFLEPSADVEPYTRALSLPSPPTDRLWVDRDQRREARQIVEAETPHGPRPVPPPRDDEPSHGLADAAEERAWQEIVAAFDAPAVDPERSREDRPGGRGRLPRRPGSGPDPDPDGPDWFGEPPTGGPGRDEPPGRAPRDPSHPADRRDPFGRDRRFPRSPDDRRYPGDPGYPGDPRYPGDPDGRVDPDGGVDPDSGVGPDRAIGPDGPDGGVGPGGPGGAVGPDDPGGAVGPDDPDGRRGPDDRRGRRAGGDDLLGPENRRGAPGPGSGPYDPTAAYGPVDWPDPLRPADPYGPRDLLGPDGPAPDRPGPHRDRDDLIADPWSDAETRRRGLRRSRGGPADDDPLPTGRDLDRAAEARARNEADAGGDDDLWIDGPPTLDGDDEHFEPPPPPPYPRLSRNTVLAVLLVLLGIVFMAVPQVLGLDDRSGLTLGVLAVLAGAVLLVLRLREARDEDGPDDGAVV